MDENEFTPSFVQGNDDELRANITRREVACTPLLRTDPVKALHISLGDPPYNTKTVAVKEASFELVYKAMAAIKEADLEAAVDSLSPDECDVLMKYIYRGLGQSGRERQYGLLLKWHAVVTKKAGQASIVRVISEVQRQL